MPKENPSYYKKTPSLLNQETKLLRNIIKTYRKRLAEIESYLRRHPDEWGKFQAEFNAEVNKVFQNIMEFEKKSLAEGRKEQVEKLKDFFVRNFRPLFAHEVYCKWSIEKPFGYAGDFKIIDDIYQNNPQTSGVDRLFDNYFQMSAISVAVRNRKEDFKRIIIDFAKERRGRKLEIMDLASGPCREIQEMLLFNKKLFDRVCFDCYEYEVEAIKYAKKLLFGRKVNFIKLNVLKIALAKNIKRIIDKKYDLIYSTGFFDYLNRKTAVKIVVNLKKLLKNGGVLAIANVRDKYSNPSVHFMEWAGDWNLVYRTDNEFKDIFIEAGFKQEDLKIKYEQQGIMQYIIAVS